MHTTRLCERCGAAIDCYAPQGLCAGCLLSDGLGGSQEQPSEPGTASTGAEARYFGDYELLQKVAQGGMGVVHKARELSTGRIVALKVLRLGTEPGPEAVKRFQTEVVAAASLQHPNIVAIHDVGQTEGQHFFTMDFVEGPTLSALAQARPIPSRQAVRYVQAIAEAVDYAHERGILHRDLKPSNVLIDEADQPRLTDFGLAKRIDNGQRSALDAQLTLTGQVLGTPNYLPPEQAEGQPRRVGRASDVYGLGAILYYLLTSRPPFVGDSFEMVLRQVIEQEPVSPRLLNPSVPRDLETICLKCLEKDPSRRYSTGRLLADELGRFQRGEPILARPVSRLERIWRWAKRRPVVAALGTGMTLTLALGIAGVTWQWQRAEAERRLQRRFAYASDMKAAQIALQQSNLGMALNLLRRYLPRGGEDNLRGIEWRYLWQMSRSDDLLSIPHPEVLRDAVLSPDARYLVTCGIEPDCLVRVWETATTNQVASFVSISGIGTRRELAFSADGRWLAFASTNGVATNSVAIVRTSDWQIARIIDPGEGVSSAPFFLSPSGRQLVMNGTNDSLQVWDLSDGQRRVLTNARASLYNLSLDPEGKLVAYSPAYALFNQPGPIGLWDLETGATTNLLENEDSVALTFSPDGQWLAAGHWSGEVSVWSTADRRPVTRYQAHEAMTFGLAFSPDSRWLATGGADQVIRFWETGTWKPSPARPALKGHEGMISVLSFSADGQKLASASYHDRTARLWNLASPAVPPQKTITLPAQAVPAGSLPDGSALVTLNSKRRAVELWSLNDGQRIRSNYWKPPETLHWSGIRAFPANQVAIGVSTNGTVYRWPLGAGTELEPVRRGGAGFRPAYLSPDGRWLVGICDGSGNDGPTVLADLRTGQSVAHFPFRWFQSCAAAFSPDNRWLAFSTPPPDYSIKLWDLSEQKVAATLTGHYFLVGAIRFSPDSRVLVSGGWTSEIRRWSIPDGKPLGAPLRGHALSVAQLAFSPDGKTLVSSGPDQTIRWWDMVTGQEMLRLPQAILASGTPYRFRETYFAGQAEFVAADKWLVWQESQGSIRVTPLPSLKEIDAIEKSKAGASTR